MNFLHSDLQKREPMCSPKASNRVGYHPVRDVDKDQEEVEWGWTEVVIQLPTQKCPLQQP